MKKLLFLPLLFMVGCSDLGRNTEITDISENKVKKFNTYLKKNYFEEKNIPYIQGSFKKYDPVLSKVIDLHASGSIEEICYSLESLFPEIGFGAEIESKNIFASIDYSGSLEAVLNNISSKAGVFWEFDKEEQKIIFSEIGTKTYIINTSSSRISQTSTLTNETEGGDENSSETSQKTETEIEYDIMQDTLKTIQPLISNKGKVQVNPAAGTITVKDTYFSIQQIDKAIKKMNSYLGQQVAIAVKVYSVNLTDDFSAGFNLKAVFDDGFFNFTGGTDPISSGIGNITSGIIRPNVSEGEHLNRIEKWGNSSTTIEALKKLGDVQILNQGSGITTHNQPFSLQSTRTETYLSQMTISTTDYGQDVTMTPAKVTEGFSMTFTPSIRNKQLMLEYNLSLVTLEGIDDFTSGDSTVQLPKLNTKAFSQHAIMNMGETLVLGAFIEEEHKNANSAGLLSFSRSKSKQKNLIIITVDVNNADLPVLSSY